MVLYGVNTFPVHHASFHQLVWYTLPNYYRIISPHLSPLLASISSMGAGMRPFEQASPPSAQNPPVGPLSQSFWRWKMLRFRLPWPHRTRSLMNCLTLTPLYPASLPSSLIGTRPESNFLESTVLWRAFLSTLRCLTASCHDSSSQVHFRSLLQCNLPRDSSPGKPISVGPTRQETPSSPASCFIFPNSFTPS